MMLSSSSVRTSLRGVVCAVLVLGLVFGHSGVHASVLRGDGGSNQYIVPPATLTSAPYAPWAHSHWVWLSNDRTSQSQILEFVSEFKAHNITVGAVDVDSGWAVGFNNFVFDTTKFPNATEFVDTLHAQDIKVILWATSMVDTNSPNYEYAKNHSYFIKNALDKDSTLHWWHGDGELIDYTNPAAVEWWHGQMDKALDLGIDGWKNDGTDPFIMEYLFPKSHAGPITYRQYADAYYGDFFNYTRQKNGEHCLTMARPVDSYPILGQAVSAYLEFAPKYVMFSGWVGDDDPNFEGLRSAMRDIIHSAWHGYANFGSDIGGYRTGPGKLGRTAQLFTRWFQMGAFVPLMENGGDKEHRPWMFDKPGSTEIVDLYRKFVEAHYELVPYLLTTGTKAFESGTSSITPMQPKPKSLPIIQLDDITNHGYMLGDQILVQPIVDENATTWTFPLPAGTWADYFNPGTVHTGGQNITVATPLEYFPVFHKTGSILPLNVTNSLNGHGSAASAGCLTLLVNSPDRSGARVEQDVHEFQSQGLRVGYSYNQAASELSFDVTATSHDVMLALQRVATDRVSAIQVVSGAQEGAQALERVPAAVPRSAWWVEGKGVDAVLYVAVRGQSQLGARITIQGL